MAKISELPQILEIDGTELIPVVSTDESGTKQNKAITAEKLAEEVKNSQSLVNREELEQTITDIQEQLVTEQELQDALIAKSDVDHNHDAIYSNKLHTHSYVDLTGLPDLPNVSQQDIEDINNQVLDLDARVISNEISIESIVTILDSMSTSDGGSSGGDASDGHTHTNLETLNTITPSKIIEWDNKSTFSGSYNDLTNKPSIPTVTNDLTDTLKSNYDTAYTHSQSQHAPINAQPNSEITKDEIEAKLIGDITTHTHSQYLTEHQSLENYATKTYVTDAINNASLGGSDINLDGYAKLTDIPTSTSQLTNDSGFLTEIPSEYITEDELTAKGYLTEHQDLTGYATETYVQNAIANAELGGDGSDVDLTNYALKTDLPTKVSELENDSGYLTSIPTEYVTETELTAKGYATTSQIPTVTNDLTDELKANYDTAYEHSQTSHFSGSYNDLTDTPAIPTKTSELTNDSGFLTSVPSEYITEDELTAKGYATTSQIPTTLPANGGNADTVGGYTIWVGTQTEYDAITTKSSTTLYFIKEG